MNPEKEKQEDLKQEDLKREVLREKYLDSLIRLAFDMEDVEALQRMAVEDSDFAEPENAEEEALVQSIWEKTQAKMTELDEAERRRRRTECRKRFFSKALNVAACLVLAVTISLPVAYASSASFREQVRQLFVISDPANSVLNFNFEKYPEVGVSGTEEEIVLARDAVPDEWTGEYFLSFIPEGMRITKVYQYSPTLEYQNASGQKFYFDELDEGATLSVGKEDAQVRYVDVNGSSACVIEGHGYHNTIPCVTIIWYNDTKWFALTGNNMDTELLLKMARSTRKISE